MWGSTGGSVNLVNSYEKDLVVDITLNRIQL